MFRNLCSRSNIVRIQDAILIAERIGFFWLNGELYILLHPKKSSCMRSAGKRRTTWKLS